jgi:hypothetical protein
MSTAHNIDAMRVVELLYSVCFHIAVYELPFLSFPLCNESNGDGDNTRISMTIL